MFDESTTWATKPGTCRPFYVAQASFLINLFEVISFETALTQILKRVFLAAHFWLCWHLRNLYFVIYNPFAFPFTTTQVFNCKAKMKCISGQKKLEEGAALQVQ